MNSKVRRMPAGVDKTLRKNFYDNRNEMEARRKYELESLIFVKIEERNYSTLIY